MIFKQEQTKINEKNNPTKKCKVVMKLVGKQTKQKSRNE